jgi:hypothetical protein
MMGGLGILLLALGAILTFALEADAEGINLEVVGVILMIVGAIGVIVSMARGTMWGFTSTREVTRDGDTVVERRRSGPA